MENEIRVPSPSVGNFSTQPNTTSPHQTFKSKDQNTATFNINSNTKALPDQSELTENMHSLNEIGRLLFSIGKSIANHNKQHFILNTAFQFLNTYLGNITATTISVLLKAYNLVSSAKQGINANFIYQFFLTAVSSLPKYTLTKENFFAVLLKYAQYCLCVEQTEESDWTDPTWAIIGVLSVIVYHTISSKNITPQTEQGKSLLHAFELTAQARLLIATLGNHITTEKKPENAEHDPRKTARLVREAFKQSRTSSNDSSIKERIVSFFSGQDENNKDLDQFNEELREYLAKEDKHSVIDQIKNILSKLFNFSLLPQASAVPIPDNQEDSEKIDQSLFEILQGETFNDDSNTTNLIDPIQPKATTSRATDFIEFSLTTLSKDQSSTSANAEEATQKITTQDEEIYYDLSEDDRLSVTETSTLSKDQSSTSANAEEATQKITTQDDEIYYDSNEYDTSSVTESSEIYYDAEENLTDYKNIGSTPTSVITSTSLSENKYSTTIGSTKETTKEISTTENDYNNSIDLQTQIKTFAIDSTFDFLREQSLKKIFSTSRLNPSYFIKELDNSAPVYSVELLYYQFFELGGCRALYNYLMENPWEVLKLPEPPSRGVYPYVPPKEILQNYQILAGKYVTYKEQDSSLLEDARYIITRDHNHLNVFLQGMVESCNKYGVLRDYRPETYDLIGEYLAAYNYNNYARKVRAFVNSHPCINNLFSEIENTVFKQLQDLRITSEYWGNNVTIDDAKYVIYGLPIVSKCRSFYPLRATKNNSMEIERYSFQTLFTLLTQEECLGSTANEPIYKFLNLTVNDILQLQEKYQRIVHENSLDGIDLHAAEKAKLTNTIHEHLLEDKNNKDIIESEFNNDVNVALIHAQEYLLLSSNNLFVSLEKNNKALYDFIKKQTNMTKLSEGRNNIALWFHEIKSKDNTTSFIEETKQRIENHHLYKIIEETLAELSDQYIRLKSKYNPICNATDLAEDINDRTISVTSQAKHTCPVSTPTNLYETSCSQKDFKIDDTMYAPVIIQTVSNTNPNSSRFYQISLLDFITKGYLLPKNNYFKPYLETTLEQSMEVRPFEFESLSRYFSDNVNNKLYDIMCKLRQIIHDQWDYFIQNSNNSFGNREILKKVEKNALENINILQQMKAVNCDEPVCQISDNELDIDKLIAQYSIFGQLVSRLASQNKNSQTITPKNFLEQANYVLTEHTLNELNTTGTILNENLILKDQDNKYRAISLFRVLGNKENDEKNIVYMPLHITPDNILSLKQLYRENQNKIYDHLNFVIAEKLQETYLDIGSPRVTEPQLLNKTIANLNSQIKTIGYYSDEQSNLSLSMLKEVVNHLLKRLIQIKDQAKPSYLMSDSEISNNILLACIKQNFFYAVENQDHQSKIDMNNIIQTMNNSLSSEYAWETNSEQRNVTTELESYLSAWKNHITLFTPEEIRVINETLSQKSRFLRIDDNDECELINLEKLLSTINNNSTSSIVNPYANSAQAAIIFSNLISKIQKTVNEQGDTIADNLNYHKNRLQNKVMNEVYEFLDNFNGATPTNFTLTKEYFFYRVLEKNYEQIESLDKNSPKAIMLATENELIARKLIKIRSETINNTDQFKNNTSMDDLSNDVEHLFKKWVKIVNVCNDDYRRRKFSFPDIKNISFDTKIIITSRLKETDQFFIMTLKDIIFNSDNFKKVHNEQPQAFNIHWPQSLAYLEFYLFNFKEIVLKLGKTILDDLADTAASILQENGLDALGSQLNEKIAPAIRHRETFEPPRFIHHDVFYASLNLTRNSSFVPDSYPLHLSFVRKSEAVRETLFNVDGVTQYSLNQTSFEKVLSSNTSQPESIIDNLNLPEEWITYVENEIAKDLAIAKSRYLSEKQESHCSDHNQKLEIQQKLLSVLGSITDYDRLARPIQTSDVIQLGNEFLSSRDVNTIKLATTFSFHRIADLLDVTSSAYQNYKMIEIEDIITNEYSDLFSMIHNMAYLASAELHLNQHNPQSAAKCIIAFYLSAVVSFYPRNGQHFFTLKPDSTNPIFPFKLLNPQHLNNIPKLSGNLNNIDEKITIVMEMVEKHLALRILNAWNASSDKIDNSKIDCLIQTLNYCKEDKEHLLAVVKNYTTGNQNLKSEENNTNNHDAITVNKQVIMDIIQESINEVTEQSIDVNQPTIVIHHIGHDVSFEVVTLSEMLYKQLIHSPLDYSFSSLPEVIQDGVALEIAKRKIHQHDISVKTALNKLKEIDKIIVEADKKLPSVPTYAQRELLRIASEFISPEQIQQANFTINDHVTLVKTVERILYYGKYEGAIPPEKETCRISIFDLLSSSEKISNFFYGHSIVGKPIYNFDSKYNAHPKLRQALIDYSNNYKMADRYNSLIKRTQSDTAFINAFSELNKFLLVSKYGSNLENLHSVHFSILVNAHSYEKRKDGTALYYLKHIGVALGELFSLWLADIPYPGMKAKDSGDGRLEITFETHPNAYGEPINSRDGNNRLLFDLYTGKQFATSDIFSVSNEHVILNHEKFKEYALSIRTLKSINDHPMFQPREDAIKLTLDKHSPFNDALFSEIVKTKLQDLDQLTINRDEAYWAHVARIWQGLMPLEILLTLPLFAIPGVGLAVGFAVTESLIVAPSIIRATKVAENEMEVNRQVDSIIKTILIDAGIMGLTEGVIRGASRAVTAWRRGVRTASSTLLDDIEASAAATEQRISQGTIANEVLEQDARFGNFGPIEELPPSENGNISPLENTQLIEDNLSIEKTSNGHYESLEKEFANNQRLSRISSAIESDRLVGRSPEEVVDKAITEVNHLESLESEIQNTSPWSDNLPAEGDGSVRPKQFKIRTDIESSLQDQVSEGFLSEQENKLNPTMKSTSEKSPSEPLYGPTVEQKLEYLKCLGEDLEKEFNPVESGVAKSVDPHAINGFTNLKSEILAIEQPGGFATSGLNFDELSNARLSELHSYMRERKFFDRYYAAINEQSYLDSQKNLHTIVSTIGEVKKIENIGYQVFHIWGENSLSPTKQLVAGVYADRAIIGKEGTIYIEYLIDENNKLAIAVKDEEKYTKLLIQKHPKCVIKTRFVHDFNQVRHEFDAINAKPHNELLKGYGIVEMPPWYMEEITDKLQDAARKTTKSRFYKILTTGGYTTSEQAERSAGLRMLRKFRAKSKLTVAELSLKPYTPKEIDIIAKKPRLMISSARSLSGNAVIYSDLQVAPHCSLRIFSSLGDAADTLIIDSHGGYNPRIEPFSLEELPADFSLEFVVPGGTFSYGDIRFDLNYRSYSTVSRDTVMQLQELDRVRIRDRPDDTLREMIFKPLEKPIEINKIDESISVEQWRAITGTDKVGKVANMVLSPLESQRGRVVPFSPELRDNFFKDHNLLTTENEKPFQRYMDIAAGSVDLNRKVVNNQLVANTIYKQDAAFIISHSQNNEIDLKSLLPFLEKTPYKKVQLWGCRAYPQDAAGGVLDYASPSLNSFIRSKRSVTDTQQLKDYAVILYAIDIDIEAKKIHIMPVSGYLYSAASNKNGSQIVEERPFSRELLYHLHNLTIPTQETDTTYGASNDSTTTELPLISDIEG